MCGDAPAPSRPHRGHMAPGTPPPATAAVLGLTARDTFSLRSRGSPSKPPRPAEPGSHGTSQRHSASAARASRARGHPPTTLPGPQPVPACPPAHRQPRDCGSKPAVRTDSQSQRLRPRSGLPRPVRGDEAFVLTLLRCNPNVPAPHGAQGNA